MFTFYLDPPINPSAVQAGAEPYRPSDFVSDSLSAHELSRSLIDGARGGINAIPDDFFSRAQQYRKEREELFKSPNGGFVYNPESADSFEYYAADLAKRYGMNRETAYSEAMANTAYQRAVVDMQNAGLNPASLFSASRASTAGSGRASGSLGSSGGYTSARGSTNSDQLPGWLFYGVTALAQAVGTAATKSFMGGYAISQVAQNAMRAFNGR